MRPGFFYYRRRIERRTLVDFLAVLGLVLAAAAMILATVRLRPLLESLATTRVSNAVNRVISESVDESIQSGAVRYDELIAFEKDNEGHITAIHSNMAACSRLQTDILDRILTRVGQVSARELSIPVGSLTGFALLAGRGPRISVRMESVGTSTAWFENEFSAAGINQTNHRIILHIEVGVAILLPGVTTSTRVASAVTVAETVIVGDVPQTYTYFATDPSSYGEDAKDYILNNG